MLDSIDLAQLTTVVGGGLSLGDRSAPPPSGNSWEPIMKARPPLNDHFNPTIDRGMQIAPKNPTADSDIWRQPYSGSSSSGGLDI